MSLSGSCACNNLTLLWRNADLSLVPRACQCDYCRCRNAAWISKSASALKISIYRPSLHNIVEQGGAGAQFHECGNCAEVVCVTAEIEGETYGAVNAYCLQQSGRFPAPVATNFSGLSNEEKRTRWRENWCFPVRCC